MKKLILLSLTIAAMLSACGNKQAEEQKTHVNWATFNIRYDNPEDSLNDWTHRKDTVAGFILAQDLDIVGMQEVLFHQMNDLQDRLPDYAHVGVCRDNGADEGEACAIFFKKDRFDALDSGTFWLSQYPDSVGFVGWDGACCRIATWAKLQDKQNGKVFMAVNTHFDHVGVEARKNAALLIIDKIKEIVGDQLAVLTGDFNVDDTSEAYETITTNEFVLVDTYKATDKVEGVSYSWHDFGKEAMEDRVKIDFIFATPTIKCLRSFIPEEPKAETGFVSDHNPVVAELEL